MTEREHAPGNSGGKPGPDADLPDESREDSLLREVLRKQELHREGGVEPELMPPDAVDPGQPRES